MKDKWRDVFSILFVLFVCFVLGAYFKYCLNNPDYTEEFLQTQKARLMGQVPVRVIGKAR